MCQHQGKSILRHGWPQLCSKMRRKLSHGPRNFLIKSDSKAVKFEIQETHQVQITKSDSSMF